jgi:hypothetical protein
MSLIISPKIELFNIKRYKRLGVITQFQIANSVNNGTIYQNVNIEIYDEMGELTESYKFVEAWIVKNNKNNTILKIENDGKDNILIGLDRIRDEPGKIVFKLEAWFVQEKKIDSRLKKSHKNGISLWGDLHGANNVHIDADENAIRRLIVAKWTNENDFEMSSNYLGSRRCARKCKVARCFGVNKKNQPCCLCTKLNSNFCRHHTN